MTKSITVASEQTRAFGEKKYTVGLDLGDRWTWYCVFDEGGEVVFEGKVSTTAKALREVLGAMPHSRVALETGMHSPWVSRLMKELGHEGIVAQARKVRLIGESRKKDDRLDARTLARLARIDPELLGPIQHRSARAQADLIMIRARAGLVRSRTALINAARGLTKSYGERLRGADAGGQFLFCDTDSAAIVSAEQRQSIAMPDGANSITALSWAEVQNIVDRFESLNPYNPKIVPGSILKIHKLNWGRHKERRQLYGYAIAAKRYALYTKTENNIEIVEPKAHGLGYFYPPKDSPEGWNHETPQWIFEAWDWIMRGVLGVERSKPAWFDLPVMMKLTLSTPHHALKNLAKGPLTRPHNFTMIPQVSRFGFPANVNPEKFTLITPFSSDGDDWMNSKCANFYDFESPVYELTDQYDGDKVVPKNFFMLLDAYQNHPEAKSFAPDGGPCKFDTRGLLRRADIVVNWPPVYIGKESDRHWEEGEDLSLLDFNCIVYKRKGYAVASEEQLARIEKVPKREFIRRRINQHTLEKICGKEAVRASKLAKVLKVLQQWESEDEDSGSSPSRGARLHRAEAKVVEDSRRVIRSQLKADRGC